MSDQVQSSAVWMGDRRKHVVTVNGIEPERYILLMPNRMGHVDISTVGLPPDMIPTMLRDIANEMDLAIAAGVVPEDVLKR